MRLVDDVMQMNVPSESVDIVMDKARLSHPWKDVFGGRVLPQRNQYLLFCSLKYVPFLHRGNSNG